MRKVIGLCVGLFVLSGCTNNIVFEDNLEIDQAGWKQEDLASFEFEIDDPAQSYNVLVHVRNTGDYQYANLYLFVNWFGPDSVFMRDTIPCTLADPTGRWLGESSGGLWFHEIPYHQNIKFPQPGKYKVQIEQAMRHEVLEEITDIGLRLEKSESNG